VTVLRIGKQNKIEQKTDADADDADDADDAVL
jgi:hypothetical protein